MIDVTTSIDSFVESLFPEQYAERINSFFDEANILANPEGSYVDALKFLKEDFDRAGEEALELLNTKIGDKGTLFNLFMENSYLMIALSKLGAVRGSLELEDTNIYNDKNMGMFFQKATKDLYNRIKDNNEQLKNALNPEEEV